MSTLVQIKAENSAGSDIETWSLTVTAAATAPQIADIPDQTIQEGTPYTGPTPVASGTAPITWSLVTGPNGMTIDASGVVSWPNPTVWALAVNVPSPLPEIGAIPDETIQEGTPYTGPTPVVSGTQPITWSLETPPDGMTIDSATGVVSWDTPTSDGSPHTITIRATNSAGSDDEVWTLTVTASSGGGGGDCVFTEHDSAEVPTGVSRIGAAGFGCDIQVAVIDTGIDGSHPDLINNYMGGINLIDTAQLPVDEHGHGTHVAGTIGAQSNGAGVVGVASKVNLHAIKVLDANGEGDFSNVIAGIDWAVQNGMDVVNLSLGALDTLGVILGGPQYIIDSPICQAVKNAVEQGVTVVVAAGNSAVDTLYQTPANCPHSLTVSAFTDLDGNGGVPTGDSFPVNGIDEFDETFAQSFSNRGQNCWDFDEDGLCESAVDNPIVNLMAPGVDILSTLPTYPVTLNGPDFNKAQDYDTLNGTSMATPHVAGAAAIYLKAHPNATPEDVRNALTSIGECTDGAAVGSAGSANLHSCPSPWQDDPDTHWEPLLDARGINP
jgi:subtilisin family serine protease